MFNESVHDYWDRVVENASYGFEHTANQANDSVDSWLEFGGVTGAVMGTAAMTMTPDYIGNTSATLATLPIGGPAGKGVGIAVNLFRGLRTAEAAIAAAANSSAAARIAGGFLRSIPGNARVRIWVWERFAGRISARFANWKSVRLPSTNGTLFSGEAGEALLILRSGAMYRGNAFNLNQFARNADGTFTAILGALTKL